MKSVLIFALTCVSAVVLLSGCGGGGGATAAAVSAPPSNAGGSVPLPNVGDVSPLPLEVVTPNGMTAATYYTSVTGDAVMTVINSDALFHHFSTLYSATDKVTDANIEILIAGPPAWRDFGSYRVFRQSASGFGAAPSVITYQIPARATVASVLTVISLGGEIRAGQSFILSLGANNNNVVSMSFTNNELRLGATTTLTIASGYSHRAYNNPSLTDNNGSFAQFSYFIHAEYSALYVGVESSLTAGAVDVDGDAYSGGVLTEYSNLPRSGTLSYVIEHVAGVYNSTLAANSRLLSGSGTLSANFSSSRVTLNLRVTDDKGEDFMSVNNLGMRLSANRNQFHCSAFSTGNICTGSIDYADDTGLSDVTDLSSFPSGTIDAVGSFYGPGAEEVAGTIDIPVGDDIEIGFIGKRQ